MRESNENITLQTIRGASILVVEDNELNQDVALGILGQAGLKVTIANNGQEAIELINELPFDLVLMDMQMPVMDGITATKIIQERDTGLQLPIIAMTANAMLQDKEKCLDAGMVDHIAKPIDPEELYTVLLKWIKPSAVNAQSKIEPILESSTTQHIEPTLNIKGLDTQLGLKRVMGSTSAYHALLRKYTQSQSHFCQDLREALAKGDTATMELLLHTAKSVNGNIGATTLQVLAEDFEQSIKAEIKSEDLMPKIDEFQQRLSHLIRSINAALPQTPPKQNQLNKDTANAVLHNLERLLTEDDSEACEVFENNIDTLKSALETQVFLNMQQTISEFNFDKALNILKQHLSSLD